mgnify:CR=1 FL=1
MEGNTSNVADSPPANSLSTTTGDQDQAKVESQPQVDIGNSSKDATTSPSSNSIQKAVTTDTDSSTVLATTTSATTRVCRYCLSGDDESSVEQDKLVSPCACRGDQEWVHTSCLRKWQRSILICQPTHPAFYTNDRRHRLCSVCRTEFTIPPPSRQELMKELTGEELAGMLNVGFLLVSDKASSVKMSRLLAHSALGHLLSEAFSIRHWICGAFLIFQIDKDSVRV